MRRNRLIQLIVQRIDHLKRAAAFDVIQSDQKLNIRLICCLQQTEQPDEEAASLPEYESLDLVQQQPRTAIPSKRAYDLIMTAPEYRRQQDEVTRRVYKKMVPSAMKDRL